jgi:uncharacterized protein YecE (DUF72 family)
MKIRSSYIGQAAFDANSFGFEKVKAPKTVTPAKDNKPSKEDVAKKYSDALAANNEELAAIWLDAYEDICNLEEREADAAAFAAKYPE